MGDPLKALSPSTLTSLTTSLESTNTSPDQLWEVMPSGFWDGEKKMVHHIGWLPIPGTMTGAIMVLSRSFVVPTTVELREALLPDCPDTTEYLFKCIYILLIKTIQKP